VTTTYHARGGLIFASCYVYSPMGSSPACERSRLLRALLKAADERFMFKYAVRVRQEVSGCSPLSGFLGPDKVLVPVPGSAPRAGGAMSVAQHLASALLDEGLGHSVWPGLQRAFAVQKSATAARGSRPTVGAHYDSFAIEPADTLTRQVILVDDIVTKGRTLLAAAARIQDAFPQAQIRAFALVRTMGLVSGVESLLDPCIGEIAWRAGDAHRTP
jgi:hypothetical protein